MLVSWDPPSHGGPDGKAFLQTPRCSLASPPHWQPLPSGKAGFSTTLKPLPRFHRVVSSCGSISSLRPLQPLLPLLLNFPSASLARPGHNWHLFGELQPEPPLPRRHPNHCAHRTRSGKRELSVPKPCFLLPAAGASSSLGPGRLAGEFWHTESG